MTEASIDVEVAILGGGIAGASLAASVAEERSVVLLEREDAPGYHSSGRSAALFSETYGNAVVRGLSVGSRAFLETPPPGFTATPLLGPRGALHVGTDGDENALAALLDAGRALVPSVRALSAAEALALVPALRPDWVRGGVLEPDAQDIDTHALLSGFLRLAGARGARILMRAEILGAVRRGGRWRVATAAGEVAADVLVDAGGAWADTAAALAGMRPLGIEPRRRTALLFEPPPGMDVRPWPIVVSVAEDVYFKPDAGLLLGSPADETRSEPCDAQPEEFDVAVAIDRIQTIADLPIRRVVRRWAGLRSFALDRTPVVGFEPDGGGFFWFAGQGGYGFQTAPAMARVGARLIAGRGMPSDLADRGVTEAALSPARFRNGPQPNPA